eukprot:TRINITY_DN8188_c0_g1_i1.p1 TRINITY_DN8188_c0_g1~~TRINITY_DN8188_c0_g1_i1.p1  ORF type:complete len:473 (+),score=70.02 TRINITY_DN8188_c0_g1_i1:88-1419(+)
MASCHEELVRQVNVLRSTKPGCDPIWAAWTRQVGGSHMLDPRQYSTAGLEEALGILSAEDFDDKAEYLRLAGSVMLIQRQDAGRDWWIRYLEEQGTVTSDPLRHPLSFLQDALRAYYSAGGRPPRRDPSTPPRSPCHTSQCSDAASSRAAPQGGGDLMWVGTLPGFIPRGPYRRVSGAQDVWQAGLIVIRSDSGCWVLAGPSGILAMSAAPVCAARQGFRPQQCTWVASGGPGRTVPLAAVLRVVADQPDAPYAPPGAPAGTLPTGMAELPPGSIVEAHGLQSAAYLNGARGRLLDPAEAAEQGAASAGRWAVHFGELGVKLLRPANLLFVSPGTAPHSGADCSTTEPTSPSADRGSPATSTAPTPTSPPPPEPRYIVRRGEDGEFLLCFRSEGRAQQLRIARGPGGDVDIDGDPAAVTALRSRLQPPMRTDEVDWADMLDEE